MIFSLSYLVYSFILFLNNKVKKKGFDNNIKYSLNQLFIKVILIQIFKLMLPKVILFALY